MRFAEKRYSHTRNFGISHDPTEETFICMQGKCLQTLLTSYSMCYTSSQISLQVSYNIVNCSMYHIQVDAEGFVANRYP